MRQLAALTLLLAVGSAAAQSGRWDDSRYDRDEIRRDDVIEAVSQTNLDLRRAQRGDRFMVRVDRSGQAVPRGTELRGTVLRVERNRGRNPGLVEMRFDEMRLPSGRRVDVDAVPVRWNDRNRRDRDGRIESSRNASRDTYILGGLIGGAAIGALLDKPLEGAMVGAVAGVLLGETEGGKPQTQVLRSGQRLGVRFLRPVEVWDGGWRDDRRDEERWRDDREWRNERSLFDGNRELDLEVRTRGGESFVELNDAGRVLGLRVDEDGDGRWFVEDGDAFVRIVEGERSFRTHRGRIDTSSAAYREGREVWVPVRALQAVRPGLRARTDR